MIPRYLHRSGERVQSLVEIVHLRENAESGDDRKDICRRMGELVITSERELQRNTKRFDRHDGNGADGRADRDVNERVLLSVYGRNSVDHDGRVDCDGEAINEETRLKRIGKNLVNPLNRFVRRRMKDDHHRTKQTHCTTQFPQRAQPLL